jgi:hypothetical protein
MVAMTIGLARHEKAVLVAECQTLGMIAVIRSLGRAGYRVHAVSSQSDALGFHSRFATGNARHPPYDSGEFTLWLDLYLAEHEICAIVPSEGFLHAIAREYEKYEHLVPDAVPLEVWNRCASKISTQLQLAGDRMHCSHLPPGGIILDGHAMPDVEQLTRYPTPFYLKADAGQAVAHAGAVVIRCEDAAQLLRETARLRPHYRALLWQSHAPGKKVGVSLWRHNGAFLAENMTLGLHMAPHTGGMMSLRETFWHESILADAKEKMTCLEWQGVAMMEYKWDPETDEFWFVEINARYWGYLHLDLLSGKDFPRLQVDGFFGETATDLGPAHRKVTCRNTVPGEIGYLVSLVKDRNVSWTRKLRETALFFGLFLHPTQRADLLFPNDRGLYWLALRRFMLRPTAR